MNLQETWNALDLEKPLPKASALLTSSKSKHPVQRLKRAYLISIGFSVVFLFVFIALLFRFEETVVRIGILAMVIAYVAFSAINLRAYQKIRTDFPMDGNLKTVLQNTYDFITGNIRYQERVGLFIYPFALAAGFLMGLSEGSGSAAEAINSQVVLIMLGVVIVLFTPLCWLLARWLYRATYTPCLVDLKKLIEELNRSDVIEP